MRILDLGISTQNAASGATEFKKLASDVKQAAAEASSAIESLTKQTEILKKAMSSASSNKPNFTIPSREIGQNQSWKQVSVYHGTSSSIDQFYPFSHFGTKDQANRIADDIANDYQKAGARIYAAKLFYRKALELNDIGVHNPVTVAEQIRVQTGNSIISRSDFSAIKNITEHTKAYFQTAGPQKGQYMFDATDTAGYRNSDPVEFAKAKAGYRAIAARLRSAGYDAIKYKNMYEDGFGEFGFNDTSGRIGGKYSWMNTSPNQLTPAYYGERVRSRLRRGYDLSSANPYGFSNESYSAYGLAGYLPGYSSLTDTQLRLGYTPTMSSLYTQRLLEGPRSLAALPGYIGGPGVLQRDPYRFAQGGIGSNLLGYNAPLGVERQLPLFAGTDPVYRDANGYVANFDRALAAATVTIRDLSLTASGVKRGYAQALEVSDKYATSSSLATLGNRAQFSAEGLTTVGATIKDSASTFSTKIVSAAEAFSTAVRRAGATDEALYSKNASKFTIRPDLGGVFDVPSKYNAAGSLIGGATPLMFARGLDQQAALTGANANTLIRALKYITPGENTSLADLRYNLGGDYNSLRGALTTLRKFGLVENGNLNQASEVTGTVNQFKALMNAAISQQGISGAKLLNGPAGQGALPGPYYTPVTSSAISTLTGATNGPGVQTVYARRVNPWAGYSFSPVVNTQNPFSQFTSYSPIPGQYNFASPLLNTPFSPWHTGPATFGPAYAQNWGPAYGQYGGGGFGSPNGGIRFPGGGGYGWNGSGGPPPLTPGFIPPGWTPPSKGSGSESGSGTPSDNTVDELKRSLNSAFKFAVGQYVGRFAYNQATDAIQKMREFEKGLIDVGKVANIQGSELEDLGNRFIKLSREIPAPTEEMLKVAAVTAQLGIEGSANIAKFTETIIKLSASSNIGETDAAIYLGQILQLTGTAVSESDKVASAILEIGYTSQATETQVARAARAIAQGTQFYKTSAADVIAFGGALASMGISTNLAASSLSRLYRVLDQSLATRGKKQDIITAVTGMSADELNKQFRSDATQGVMTFLKSLNEYEKKFGSAAAVNVLEKLGLGGNENMRVIPVLANQYDFLVKSHQRAVEQMDTGSRFNEAYGRTLLTVDARLKILGNTVDAVKLRLLNSRGAMSSFIDSITKVVALIGGLDNADVVVTNDKTGKHFENVSTQAKAAAAMIKLTGGAIAVAFGANTINSIDQMIAKTGVLRLVLQPIFRLGLMIAAAYGAIKLGGWLYDNYADVQKYGAGFVEFISNSWEEIKYATSMLTATIGKLFSDMWVGIQEGAKKAIDMLNSAFKPMAEKGIPGASTISQVLTAASVGLQTNIDEANKGNAATMTPADLGRLYATMRAAEGLKSFDEMPTEIKTDYYIARNYVNVAKKHAIRDKKDYALEPNATSGYAIGFGKYDQRYFGQAVDSALEIADRLDGAQLRIAEAQKKLTSSDATEVKAAHDTIKSSIDSLQTAADIRGAVIDALKGKTDKMSYEVYDQYKAIELQYNKGLNTIVKLRSVEDIDAKFGNKSSKGMSLADRFTAGLDDEINGLDKALGANGKLKEWSDKVGNVINSASDAILGTDSKAAEKAKAMEFFTDLGNKGLKVLESIRSAAFGAGKAMFGLKTATELTAEEFEAFNRVKGLFDQLNEEGQLAHLRIRDRGLARDVLNIRKSMADTNMYSDSQIEEQVQAYIRGREELENYNRQLRLSDDIGSEFGNTLVDITTGATSLADAFKNLALSVEKLVLQYLVAEPVAKAISSLVSGTLFPAPNPTPSPGMPSGFAKPSATGVTTQAFGGAWMHGSAIPFAFGDVVDRPQMFNIVGGRYGIMGEAGPEAIMPLTRTPSGHLGVRASGGSHGPSIVNNVVVKSNDPSSFRASARTISSSLQKMVRG